MPDTHRSSLQSCDAFIEGAGDWLGFYCKRPAGHDGPCGEFQDIHQSAVEQNLAAMAAHGVESGQVRRYRSTGIVTVLGPAETWPRNGRGLVRTTIQWGDGKPEVTHYWPETLAKFEALK